MVQTWSLFVFFQLIPGRMGFPKKIYLHRRFKQDRTSDEDPAIVSDPKGFLPFILLFTIHRSSRRVPLHNLPGSLI